MQAIQVETQQVTLALVDEKYTRYIPELDHTITGKDIHKQLTTNRVWKNDHEGKYVSVQFNAQEFQFRPASDKRGRTVLTFGKTVADALLRSSVILVGPKEDALTNPGAHFLQVVDSYEMGVEKKNPSATICGLCGKDMQTFPRLTRHYEKHKKTNPELFEKTAAFEKEEDTEEGAD